MSLRLTVLLGPREVVEAAELKLGVLPGVLAMAVPFDSWNEAAGGNVLPVAMAKVAEMFAAGIKRGEHLAEPEQEGVEGEAAEPPPDQPASPAPVVHASAELTTAQKNVALERHMRVPAGPLYDAVLRELLGEETWAEVYEAVDKARRIVALVERRAA